MTIDRQPKFSTSNDHRGKPRFGLVDLPYLMPLDDAKTTPVANRSVMIVNGVGGREVQVAKAYGFGRIDVFEEDAHLVRDIFVDRYADKTGFMLHDPERVHLYDGLHHDADPDRRYSRVIVHGFQRYSDVPTRLLNHQRLLSRRSVRRYLNHLDPDGSMYLLLPQDSVASVFATILEAWSLDQKTAAPHVMICARPKARLAIILAHGKPRDAVMQRKLTKRCRSSGYYEAYPVNLGSPQVESKDPSMAVFDGKISDDRRPFATPIPAAAALRAQSRAFLKSLRPLKERKAKRPPTGKGKQQAAVAKRPYFGPVVGRTMAAFLTMLWAMIVVLLMVVFPARASANGKNLPMSWRLSVVLFGLGHAAALLGLLDTAMVAFGSRSAAYLVLLPASFVGIGVGRLAVATARNSELQRRVAVFMVAGIAALLALYLASRGTSFGAAPEAAAGATFVASLIVGAPLAIMVRRSGDVGAPVFGARLWSGYAAGWALGAAGGALLMAYWGHHRVFALGAASFALGVVMHVVVGRGRVPEPQPTATT